MASINERRTTDKLATGANPDDIIEANRIAYAKCDVVGSDKQILRKPVKEVLAILVCDKSKL